MPIEVWLETAAHLTRAVPSQSFFFKSKLEAVRQKKAGSQALIEQPGKPEPNPDAADPTRPIPADPVLHIWQEKLTFLRVEYGTASGAAKFALQKQIEEAEAKVREFGGTP